MYADSPDPDEVWNLLVQAVIDSRTDWRRAVSERTGLPFSRIRVLKRLNRLGPMSLKDLAAVADMDAPATTVAVNELEDRGCVSRSVAAHDRRCKVVTITDAGRAILGDANAIDDPAPDALRALPAAQLQSLAELARALAR
ncbi:MarR family winged helix-turn-helix transcriptional regulator [Tsukamurella soli]|uniref:HTH marR-type domain-containing protein n=1 Tax=Tsukamurella soli TaxID=644556 RepID=A0ABP8JCN6_9ACTN